MSPLPAASREPRYTAHAGRLPQGGEQRLRLRQPPAPSSRWQRATRSVRRGLHAFVSWTGWPKLAAIATALTAVAALWFSAKSLGSTEKSYALSEKGQVTDRFTKAVEQLGSDKLDVRLGGIYSLEGLAKDSRADRSVIFEVLSAYIRTHAAPPKEGCDTSPVPDADVQAAATVIGRRERPAPRVESIDLRNTCLANVALAGAYLDGARLDVNSLTGADFRNASLANVGLVGANLTYASFVNANLTGANLSGAILYGSFLDGANLSGAVFADADLAGARLVGAKLVGTDFEHIFYDATTKWPQGFTPPPSRPHKDQF